MVRREVGLRRDWNQKVVGIITSVEDHELRKTEEKGRVTIEQEQTPKEIDSCEGIAKSESKRSAKEQFERQNLGENRSLRWRDDDEDEVVAKIASENYAFGMEKKSQSRHKASADAGQEKRIHVRRTRSQTKDTGDIAAQKPAWPVAAVLARKRYARWRGAL